MLIEEVALANITLVFRSDGMIAIDCNSQNPDDVLKVLDKEEYENAHTVASILRRFQEYGHVIINDDLQKLLKYV